MTDPMSNVNPQPPEVNEPDTPDIVVALDASTGEPANVFVGNVELSYVKAVQVVLTKDHTPEVTIVLRPRTVGVKPL